MNYEDYFEIEHNDNPNGKLTMDEFIAGAMRTDMKYDVTPEAIDHLCSEMWQKISTMLFTVFHR